MLFRLITFSSPVLLIKMSFQFTNEIARCIHTASVFCNPKLPYSKVEEEVC